VKRFVFLSLFLITFALTFASGEVASITLNGTPLSDAYYQVNADVLQGYLNDALGSYQQQGISLDPYFSSQTQNAPSQIELKYNILKNLLDDKIAGYYAQENGLFPKEEEVSGYTDQITTSYFSNPQYVSQIEMSYGSTETFWRVIESYVRSELIKQNILKTLVTDYPSEASATELKKLIENGSLTFEDAAKKYSIDTGSAQNGGSIGEFSRGELVKEFEDASFAATPGEIVGPVETEYGYHLIRVDSKSTFDSVEELLTTNAYTNVARDFQNKVYLGWFNNYKANSPLGYVIYDPELDLLDRLMKSQVSI